MSGVTEYSNTVIWKSPNNTEVCITVLGSQSIPAMVMDMRGIMFMLIRDFPYLTDGYIPIGDINITNVKCLVGADGSIADESTSGQVLTNSGVTIGTGIIADSTGSIVVDNVNDGLTAADNATLEIGSNDFTGECWFSGPAALPSGEIVWFSKLGANNREFAVNLFSNGWNMFASGDGANWTATTAFNYNTVEMKTFFNGAPRHIALVKSGSSWWIFVNGEKLPATITVGTVFDGTAPLQIILSGVAPVGTIDDFRMTVGTARYTANMVTLDPRKFPRS